MGLMSRILPAVTMGACLALATPALAQGGAVAVDWKNYGHYPPPRHAPPPRWAPPPPVYYYAPPPRRFSPPPPHYYAPPPAYYYAPPPRYYRRPPPPGVGLYFRF